MAYSYMSSGAVVYSNGNPSPATPTHNANDLLILTVGTKPDTTPATTPNGWTQLGASSGGTGSTGIDTGPMRVGVFYRIADGTALDTTGAITITGNNVSAAQVHRFQPAFQNSTLDIAGVGAADSTSGAPHSVSMPSDPGLTANDMLLAVGVVPTDSWTGATTAGARWSNETVSAAGMTTVTMTEIAEWADATGQDIGGWVARGAVVTGTSTGVPTVSATPAGTVTVAGTGPIYLARIREVPFTQTDVSGSDTGAMVVADVANVVVTSSLKSASDAGSVSAADSSIVTAGPFNSLVDDFNDNTFDSNAWATWAGTAVESSGQLQLTSASTDIETRKKYRLDPDTDIVLEVVSVQNDSNNTGYLEVKFTTSMGFYYTDSDNTIGVYGPVDEWFGTYDPVAHRWIRFARDSGNNVSAQTSPDGFTWTTRHTFTITEAQKNGTIYMMNQYGGTSTTTAILDNLNNAPQLILISASDTGSVSIVDSATVDVFLSRNDATSVAGADTSAPQAQFTKTDAGSASVDDSAVVAGTINTSDSGVVTITEAASVFPSTLGNDGGAVAAADIANVAGFSTRSDTGSVAVSDTAVVSVALVRSDQTNVSVNEAVANNVTFSAADTDDMSIGESSVTDKVIFVVDSGSLIVVDTASVSVSAQATDSSTISVTDQAVTGSSSIRTDTLTASVIETVQTDVTLSAQDSGAVTFDDRASIIGPTTPKAGNEGISVSVSDNANVSALASLPGQDSPAIGIIESVSVVVSLIANDTVGISGEPVVSGFAVQGSASDQGAVGATEVTQTTVSLARSDTTTAGSIENAVVFLEVSASDSGGVAIIESNFIGDTRLANDTGALAISETANVSVGGGFTKNASDQAGIVISESSSISTFVPPTEPFSFDSKATYDILVGSETESTSQISTESETVIRIE